MVRVLRLLLDAVPYLLAIVCLLLAPLWVFGIPGQATYIELVWFLCSFFAMLAYPLVTFVFGVERLRTWRGRGRVDLARLRRGPWIALALLFLVQSPILVSFYSEWRRSVLWWEEASPNERMWSAVRQGDRAQIEALLDDVDIDRDLFNGETAVLVLAKYRSWDLVELLLERGADPDIPDDRGETLRSFVSTFEGGTRTEQEAPLGRVRAFLDDSRP